MDKIVEPISKCEVCRKERCIDQHSDGKCWGIECEHPLREDDTVCHGHAKPEGWEAEFDALFVDRGVASHNAYEVKSFIRSILKSEREMVVGRLREAIKQSNPCDETALDSLDKEVKKLDEK